MVTPETIERSILFLRNEKKESFKSLECQNDMGRIVERCRINDLMLLPLYYCWEKVFHMELVDVGFEKHLVRSYQMFSSSPIANTLELMLLIGNINQQTGRSQSLHAIIETYNEIVDYLLRNTIDKNIISI